VTCVLCGRDRDDQRHGEDGHKPMILPDRLVGVEREPLPISSSELQKLLETSKGE